MRALQIVVGVLMILAGIAAGLYVGLWVLFIGGIVSVLDAAKATPVDKGTLAWGVVRIFVASPVGWIICYLVTFVGYSIVVHKPAVRRGPTNRQVERDWERRMRG